MAKNAEKFFEEKDEKIIFKRFPGHTAEEMSFYAEKPLRDQKPEKVVIVAGTNDLTRDMFEKECVDEFAVVESLMKIGRTAREYGAKMIHISSIMVRRGNWYRGVVEKVNDLLYMACVAENFLYMDQADITMAHISSSDGVHLNSHGTTILLFNILSTFDTFDASFMDFKIDYEYPMSIS